MKKIHITRLATVAGVTGALAVAAFAIAGEKAAPQAVAAPATSSATVKFVAASPEMMAKFSAPTKTSDGMRAYVDAETKGLRAPTQAELNEGAASSARVAAPAAAKRSAAGVSSAAVVGASTQKLANGSTRLKLDESSLSYAVATIGPDGKLKTACIENQPSEEAALRTAVAQKGADNNEK